MRKSAVLTNACWILAVAGAFWLGGQGGRGGEEVSRPGEEQVRTGGMAFRGDGGGGLQEGGLSSRGVDRAGMERSGGLLARLFGGEPRADGDLELLVEGALRDPNPVMRRLAFAKLLESMTPENALEIREQMVALNARGGEWDDFNYAWGALAGKEAFDVAAKSEERDMEAVLAGWASANPSEALALLGNLPEDMRGSRDQITRGLVAGLADSDRGLATELVMRLAGEGDRQAPQLMEMVARETLRADGTEGAVAWSKTLADGPMKGAALNQIAGRFVREDPVAAAAWAEQYADQEYAAGAIREVGGEWAERDPLSAVTWLETLPEGKGQSAGLNSAFGDWEDRDPVAAGDYLMAMPQSVQRDSAISGFAAGYAWQDPQTAIAWANDISDPNLREETLTQAGQAYFRRDPEGAKAWLATSGLPEEVQQAVVTRRRR